jgi:hypothetical protein
LLYFIVFNLANGRITLPGTYASMPEVDTTKFMCNVSRVVSLIFEDIHVHVEYKLHCH